MATDVERLQVSLEANLKAYERELARASKITVQQLRKIEREAAASMTKVERSFGGVGAAFKGLLGGIGAGLSIGVVSQATVKAIQDVAAIGDLAENIGITAEQLQTYQRLAEAAGATSENLARGLQSIAEQSVEADSKLAKLFAANGLQVNMMSTNDTIRAFLDLLQNARTPAEQLAIATSVLGDRVGRDLVEAFRAGSEGVDAAFRNMVDSGIYHSDEQVKRIQEVETAYNKATARIATVWQMMVIQMVAGGEEFVATTRKELEYLQSLYNWITGTAPPQTVAPGKTDREVRQPLEFTIFPDDGAAERPKRAIRGIQQEIKGLGTAYDDLKARGQAVWEDTRTPLERYQLEIRNLNDLMKAGVIDQDTYARAVKNLQDEFSTASDSIASDAEKMAGMMQQIADDLSSGFADAIGSMIDGTQSFEDAIKSMVSNVVRNLSDLFLNQAFSGIFGGATAGGGLFGSLFGGFAGLYANGGTIPSGKWGIAGEAGPEIVRGPAQVVPFSRMQAGGAAQAVHININLAGANGNAEVARIARESVRQGLREYDRQRPLADSERSLRVQ